MQVTIPVENDDGSVKFEVTFTPEQHQALLTWALSMSIAMGLASQFVDAHTAMLLEDENTERDD